MWTSINVLDLRSLAAFRILLGAYLLYDIYARLSLGRYDLAWYTSEPDERSFLAPTDTPHKAPLHQYWFYRGSAQVQVGLFGLSTVLAFWFTLGYRCNGALKILLWVTQVAQHSRNMEVTDGSDAYIRHLLFWSCFLPLAQVWSVDAKRRSKPPSSQKLYLI